jgi:hypothetical protein
MVKLEVFSMLTFCTKEATFRCPDQRGWKPTEQLILPKFYTSKDHHLTSNLGLAFEVDKLLTIFICLAQNASLRYKFD